MSHEADDFTCPRCHVNHTPFANEICDECAELEEYLNKANRAVAAKGKKPSKKNKDIKKRKLFSLTVCQ